MPLLEIDDLSVAFGNNTVLAGASLRLEAGERFGIIGESGSGKTMMALAIAGLLPEGARRGGSIRFDGAPLPQTETDVARLRGRRIGMVFQEPMTALNPLMRIGAQIEEAIRLSDSTATLEPLLREVGLEAQHARRYPHELSGGQRQRAMIAMALAGEPDLLIADEPTSALDLITQRRIIDLIAAVCASRGMALLFISHDLRAVATLCERVLVLRRGDTIEQGHSREVFSTPRAEYTRMLVAASRPRIRPVPTPVASKRLLEVSRLRRQYRQPGKAWLMPGQPLAAVDDVSFTVATAESVAIVGPSGCGKTTLARVVAGLDKASAGSMSFDGQHYHGSDLPRVLRRDISLVFQDPFGSFDPRLEIGRAVGEPLRLERGLAAADRFTRIAEAVEAVGLGRDMLGRYPHEFSGGQRQRFAIARALVTRPRLVVLDEPVSALDVSLRGEVLSLLNRLRSDFGLAFLVISHDLEMVRAVSDRVLVMEKGRIVEEGRPEEIFEHPKHRLTQELLAARLPDVA